ncbi:hypothetical protein MIR68_011741 [Amoeboaphelidium protococcarum]|nr:hypothetical protein MIR68_011741 [Amoeboaphelidium protococcarum]
MIRNLTRTRQLVTRVRVGVRFASQASASAQKVPVAEDALKPASLESPPSERVQDIASQITRLSLLETSQLVAVLKSQLGITDAMMAVPAAGSASVQQTAGAAASGGDADQKTAQPEAPKKTKFSLKLVKIDAAQKAKVIREIKNLIPNINLVEAKKFVESAPKVVRENISKEDCDKIKAALEAVGATVEVE